MRPNIAIALLLGPCAHATIVPGLPTVPFKASLDDGSWHLADLSSLVVDANFADSKNEDGMTLIPPSLLEFANTFVGDIQDIFQVDLAAKAGSACHHSRGQLSWCLVGHADSHTAADPRERIAARGDIHGQPRMGRARHDGELYQHIEEDARANRHQLDVARHYYPAEFLVDICSYMSFFKQNVFHIHLSDNLWNNVAIYSYERQMSLYSAFRLLSDDPAVEGLAARRNESYTREVWDDIQNKCAARGVTILPEIEAPGHALPITQWKPEIGMSTDYSLLNISNPETLPTMKTIWKTFLPWFQSKTIHIGADEYRDPSLDDL
jgi:hexosaminidase